MRPPPKTGEHKPLKKGTRVVTPKHKEIPKAPKPKRSIHSIPIVEMEHIGKRARLSLLTALEKRSVSSEVQAQYESYSNKFKDFCQVNDVVLPLPAEEADALMADYLDLLFLEGGTAAQGEKSVAALEFHLHQYKNKLPRSKRSLRGWRKMVPPQSRLPLPRLAMYGLAMQLMSMNKRTMAMMVVTSFDLYLRPGEAIDLKGRNIVPPIKNAGRQYQWVTVVVRDIEGQQPDKTGVYDNSLAINNKETLWLGKELVRMSKGLSSPNDALFPVTMEDYRKNFIKAGQQLGLGETHPYQLRHGGATEDLTSGRRDHNAVKSRGRWKTDGSVRRYAKSGKVQQLLGKMSRIQLNYCHWAEKNMAKVVLGLVQPRSCT